MLKIYFLVSGEIISLWKQRYVTKGKRTYTYSPGDIKVILLLTRKLQRGFEGIDTPTEQT